MTSTWQTDPANTRAKPRRRAIAAAIALALAVPAATPVGAQQAPPAEAAGGGLAAADAAVASGRYRAAVTAYEAILAGGDDAAGAPVAALKLAELALGLGDPLRAYDALASRLDIIAARLDGEALETGIELLADAASRLGRTGEAVDASERLVAARTGRLGADAPATQAARLTLSIMLGAAGRGDEADRLRRDAFAVLARGDRDLYVRILNNTAINLQNGGRLAAAAETFRTLIDVLSAAGDSPELGITAFNAAVLSRDMRRYDEAARLHEESIRVLEKTTGSDSAETIAAIGGLGQTYGFAGRPTAALPFLRDAYARAEKSLGDTDDTMIQANNLAAVLREIGRHAEARPLDERAYRWRTEHLGPAADATLVSRKNYALDLIGLGEVAAAKAEYDGILAVLQKTRGEDDPSTRAFRRDAEMVAVLTGAAKPGADIATSLPADVQPTAESVKLANWLAGIAERRGEPAEELRLHRWARRLAEAYYGDVHPMTITMIGNVARAEREQRDPAALASYTLLEERLKLWARREVASAADSATAEEVAAVTRETLGDIVSYSYAEAQRNPYAAELFASVLLDWKDVGSLERTLLASALPTLPPDDRALADKVATLRAASLERPRDAGDGGTLDRELAGAEAVLAEKVDGLRRLADERRVGYREVLARIGGKGATIDYLVAPMKMKTGVEDRILAMVGHPSGDVSLYDLGPAAAVEALVETPEDAIETKSRKALYEILVAPLEKKIDGAEVLHVVPDGVLYLVPFDGLIDGKGKNLIETRDVRVARSIRAVTGPTTPLALAGAPMLLVGGLDYGGEGSAKPLPFTESEVDTIADIGRDAGLEPAVLRGKDAGEAAVRAAVAGKRIVHLATHGFFDPVPIGEPEPLWRAGIDLSGSNRSADAASPLDDGVAHAAEIVQWPLDGVDLVVLSACDTALGDRSYVEGLRGLPSALAAAGAKRSLVARWPVPDTSTAIFMSLFYAHLAETGSYEGALRLAKIDAIDRVGEVAAKTWLGFVLIEN